VGLLVPNRLVLGLRSSNILAVLDRYLVSFLEADVEVGYAAKGHEGFLDVLGYIAAIEGMGLSLTKSFTVAASCIRPSGDHSNGRALGSYFLCKLERL